MAVRDIKYGNDFFRTLKREATQSTYNACYWDLWIAILLTNQFDNNWETLIATVKSDKSSTYDSYNRQEKYRALANHIRNLKAALAHAELEVQDIVSGIDADVLKTQEVKAKKKVLALDFKDSEKTDWMIHTPKKQLYEKALNGNWQEFPINPTKYAVELEKKFKKSGFYHKGETRKLEEKIEAFFEKNIKNASVPKQIAVYRAGLSVILINMDSIDDSFGTIGYMYRELFETYINIDRSELGMSSKAFLTDILELIIWENYGCIDVYETGFFKKLSPEEVIEAESILRNLSELFRHLELPSQTDGALTALSVLYARHKLFDKFVSLAKELETRDWQRITLLAQTANENGKRAIALQVFEACLVEGFHYTFLKERYDKLLSENG